MSLPYGPNDDDAASEVVSEEVKRPNRERWAAMTTDARVLQTDRVLRAIIRSIDVTFTHRNAEIAAVRADFASRKISNSYRRRAVEAYEEWKARTMTFRSKAVNRREQIQHRVRQLGGDLTMEAARSTLRTLAIAVADHQTAITSQRDPTPADRLLWLRLDTLMFPIGKMDGDCVPLADIVKEDRTTPIVAREHSHDE